MFPMLKIGMFLYNIDVLFIIELCLFSKSLNLSKMALRMSFPIACIQWRVRPVTPHNEPVA